MRPIDHAQAPMTLEEYLAWEEQNVIKHEYVAGEVYAMSGVTKRHNLITLNLVRSLHALVRPRGCQVFATDIKLRASSDRIYHPDVVVACGAAANFDLIIEAPTLVVEVTSPSTRATDRREKLEAYMRMPSLRVYLIVEQRRRQVLVYRRDPDATWTREEITSGDVELALIGGAISVDEIYDDVPLPPMGVGENEDMEEEDSNDFA
jgi:Uma2 family endonuclease